MSDPFVWLVITMFSLFAIIVGWGTWYTRGR